MRVEDPMETEDGANREDNESINHEVQVLKYTLNLSEK